MNYHEAIEWLESRHLFGIKLGLQNITALLDAMGNPQRQFRSIHIAGTNGKGSTGAMLERLLRCHTKRVGFNSSPHLEDFRERIRVAGEDISPALVADTLTRIRPLAEAANATFFEIATALAFDIFAQEGCEWAVIETGMGGRLDATNVILPEVSVITPIGLDHAKHLGDTLAAIAREKAGIIKPSRSVISAQQSPEAVKVLRTTAHQAKAPLHFVETPYNGRLALEGLHQHWNAALALAALEAINLVPSPTETAKALLDVRWRGRFQRLGERWILDGTHNAHGAAALVATWRAAYGELRVPVVFGCLADKDYVDVLRLLSSIASSMHYVPVANERALPPAAFAEILPGTVHGSLREAIESLAKKTNGDLEIPSTPILITGSLYLIGEALGILKVPGSF